VKTGPLVAQLDALLTAPRVRAYAAVFLVLGMLGWAALVARGQLPLDAAGRPVAVDFTAHYTAGRMALAGEMGRLYDPLVQRSHQRQFLGQGEEWDFLDLYLSPPFVAYLYAPLAALPYVPAAALWLALTAVVLLAAVRLLWPLAPGLHGAGFGLCLLVALSAQPVLELLGDGQDSALALLIAVGALRLLVARRDLLAGGLLGLGAFKPQLFLLVPIALVAERRWRALLAAAAVGAALTGASVLAVGTEGMGLYADLLGSALYRQNLVLDQGWKMVSLPALTRVALPGALPLARASVGALLALGVVVTTIVIARRTPAHPQRLPQLFAMALLGSLLVSPHAFLYDCVMLFVPAAILLGAAPRRPELRVALAAVYLLLWTTPLRVAVTLGRPSLALLAAPWGALGLLALFVIGQRKGQEGTTPSASGHYLK
jgi:hypothetical protein